MRQFCVDLVSDKQLGVSQTGIDAGLFSCTAVRPENLQLCSFPGTELQFRTSKETIRYARLRRDANS